MRILIFRHGAFGDVIVTTPVVRYLAGQGHEIVYVANERGVQVLKGNPHVKTLIEEKTDATPNHKLSDHISYLQKKYKCERVIDFSESIEVALSLHPKSPDYNLSKKERFARFNRNFYEYAFEHAKENWGKWSTEPVNLLPELFFDKSELDEAHKYLKPSYFNVLFGMSGSGHNKAYPHYVELAERICEEIPEAHIITVGDERCRLIEPEIEGRVTNLSGKVPMRTSMALTGLVDLVISPDTGLLHASGCYPTPKIALLGHTTGENITKHFSNCYNVEADSAKAPCSPCFRLIYNMKMQCPLNHVTQSSICMAEGVEVDRILTNVKEVYRGFLQNR